MALSNPPILFFFSIFLLSYFSNAKNPSKPLAFIFPIHKQTTSNLYYTTIPIGSNSTSLNLLIDLGGELTWFNSVDYYSAASSYRPIPCKSKLCQAIDGGCIISCYESSPAPGCSNKTCADYALNPFTGTVGYNVLGQDVLRVYSVNGGHYNILKRFPFQFSDPVLLEKLPTSTSGLLGLGRSSELSLLTQLALSFKIQRRLTLCLPSNGKNHGNLIIGQVGSYYKPPFQTISKDLITTPLIWNRVSTYGNDVIGNFTTEYFIDVKSIRVDNKTLSLNKTLLSIDKVTGAGGTSIRTVRSYTGLHRSIYRVVVNEFVKAAEAMHIKRVASVAPFGACFDSKNIVSSKTGPRVPIIDLVLQKSSVYWRFYGSNSMVRVSENVICLAFVEEIPNTTGPTTSIVVGGHQLENYLIEFDVDNSEIRLSSSLALHNTSCSYFRA